MSTHFEIWPVSGCQFMLYYNSSWSRSIIGLIYTSQQSEHHKRLWLLWPLPSFVAFSASVKLRGGRGLVFRVGRGVHYFEKQMKMGEQFLWWEMVVQFLPLRFYLGKHYPNNWLKYLYNKLNISTRSIVAVSWNLGWILYNRITNFNCGKISYPVKFSLHHVTFFAILNYQARYTIPRALGLILPQD